MTDQRHNRARYVIGPLGTPLTMADLPPRNTKRWIIHRKAELVAAVRGGLLSLALCHDGGLEEYIACLEAILINAPPGATAQAGSSRSPRWQPLGLPRAGRASRWRCGLRAAKSAPCVSGGFQDGADLAWSRDIYPNLHLLLMPRGSLATPLALAHWVARGESALLRVSDNAAEAGDDLACQRR